METGIDFLWQQYRSERSPDLMRQLALNYLGLVRYVIKKFRLQATGKGRLLDQSDIVQFGVLGLLDAVNSYRPSMGVKFETYAVTRIKGTIQDELRKLDWVPRSVRKRAREVQRLTREAESTISQGMTAQNVAEKLALSLDDYQEILHEAGGFPMDMMESQHLHSASIEEVAVDGSADPLEAINAEEVKTLLIDLIEHLPRRERLIIALYYYEGLMVKEIAKILHLSESRVSQIHTEVLDKLRRKLEPIL